MIIPTESSSKGLFTLNVARKELFLSESLLKLLGKPSDKKLFSFSAIEAEDVYFNYKARWVNACVGLRVLERIKREVHLEFKLKSKHHPEAIFQLTAFPSPQSDKNLNEIFVVLINMDKTLENSQQIALTNKRLERVQEVGGLGYFLINLEEGFWEVSPVLGRLLEFDEYRNNDLYAWAGFIHPEYREETMALFNECMQNQTFFRTRYRALRKKSKDYVWLEVAGEFEYLEDGKPKWMLGTAKDITQMYQTMHNLELTNRFLQETQAVARLGTFNINFRQDSYEISEVLQEILELESGEANRLRGWSPYIHPEDANRVNNYFLATVRNKEEKHEISYRIITKESSRIRWLESKSEIIYSEEGEPLEMIGTVLDISERVRSMEQLEKQNATLRDIAWDQSHLVRGPISRIQGLMIELEEEPIERERSLLIREVKNSVYELDDIVRRVVQKTDNLEPMWKEVEFGFNSKKIADSSSTFFHIVDDDPIIRTLHTKLVQRINASIRVICSKDGHEFIEFIELHKEDHHLVLLDINMPKCDGWDVLDYLSNSRGNLSVRVIMVSSSTNNRDQQRALKSSFVIDYITKPLQVASVTRILKDFV